MARRTAAEAEVTRRALLEAALEAFAESGYTATRLEDVAERAGVTRGALYHHFEGKAELYVAALDRAWGLILPRLLSELHRPGPPLERLERFATAYLRAAERDERFRALLAVTVLGSEALPELQGGLEHKRDAFAAWIGQLEPVLAEARRRGELRAGLTARQAAVAVLACLTGATTTAQLAPRLLSPAREARRLSLTLVRGLAAAGSAPL